MPTATCPNERVAGDAVRRCVLEALPPTESRRFELDELLVNAIFAPLQPLCVGAKVTSKLTVCDAARTTGRLKPVTVNSELPGVIAEIVTLLCPVLVRVIG